MDEWPPGIHPGKSLTNPVTGQTVTFLERSSALLVLEATYRAGGPLAPEHYHPVQTEHFVALDGGVRVVVDGQERRLEQGEELTLPPGTPHRFGALAETSGRVRWEVRPALRTAEFLDTTFGLAQAGQVDAAGRPPLLLSAQIARTYDLEFRLSHPPRWVQRIVFTGLGVIARRRSAEPRRDAPGPGLAGD